MAAAPVPPLVSLYEYLHSDYQPDMDYIDGVLEGRNSGENEPSDLQTELAFLFRTHRDTWSVKAFVEQRIQVAPTRFRVPDLCVMPASWKRTPIITEPPLLCIEVLSPEDRFGRIRARCDDYFKMGVQEAWVFDPAERIAFVLRPDGIMTTHREGSLQLAGTTVEVPLPEVFRVLDDGTAD